MKANRQATLDTRLYAADARRPKTRDDRTGPGVVLAHRVFGAETVELLATRNGYRRVDWRGRRRWLGGDPETARQTYQRYCLRAFLLDGFSRLRARLRAPN